MSWHSGSATLVSFVQYTKHLHVDSGVQEMIPDNLPWVTLYLPILERVRWKIPVRIDVYSYTGGYLPTFQAKGRGD